jgi:DNA-binding MarR family transcriptional regulator
MNNESHDTEYIVLEKVYDSTERQVPLRQRDLARIAGTSLGMINAILKRLTRKGWITVKKLNNRNIQYAITLEGMNEVIHRSYGYFKRTIRNVVYYKDHIDDAISKAKQNAITAVILAGISDLEFIVEHACHRHGLSFLKVVEADMLGETLEENILIVYAENISRTEGRSSPPGGNALFLSRMVLEIASEGT